MRTTLRFLVSGLISCSIALAIMPAQSALLLPTEKMSCCAKMKAESAAHGCARHAPKPEPEKQCCAGCVFCLAILPPSPTPFVYPSTGEESFAAFIAGELNRPHRPQVPPPRSTVA
jgi:hypothetical protein